MPTQNADKWLPIPEMPSDAIFEASKIAVAAPSPKANLIIGAYRDEDGNPYPLRSIRKAEALQLSKNANYEYIPFSGYAPFVDAAVELMYGPSVKHENIVAYQALSGTGALYLGASLLASFLDLKQVSVYLPDPTWINHVNIFQGVGWRHVKKYRYYDPKTLSLDFDGMKEDALAAPNGSVFILHACAHNPTGVDPTERQWEELADLFQKKEHFAFFDCAYLGFASGSVDRDAFAVRLFVEKGLQILCAQSFAKNMGLYNQRIGLFSIALQHSTRRQAVTSMLDVIVRRAYGCPPAHGARLVHLVLTEPTLREEWLQELKEMASRIHLMRVKLHEELRRLGTPGSWTHILTQKGMFSFLGLTEKQCKYCWNHNAFITMSGRANMAALTDTNVIFLAKQIHESIVASHL